MTKKYMIGQSEDEFEDPQYDSKEEAIQAGIGEYMGDIFYIGVARKPAAPEEFFDGWGFIERVGEHEDYYWKDYAWTMTMDKVDDFESHVQQAIKDFLDKHNLNPTHWVVDEIEKIDPKEL
jgi:hypothetical protein